MWVKYDSLNRHEPLIITLCNPGSTYSSENFAPDKVIGMIIDTSAEELRLNFNQVSELAFRVTRTRREDDDEDIHAYQIYKAIQNRRLLFVTGIGYFMISGVSDEEDENGLQYKDVSAKSIEAEIQNRKVPYIADGTYRFSTDVANNDNGLFETLVETLPLWAVGTVDNVVASKYRTFEDVDTNKNTLSFMIDNMQDAYECIFIFDIINRTINVYEQNNYVRQTNIHITKNDLIKGLNITENTDDLYTALSVMGNDNITISAINPLGGNVIYDFSHYLSWMSDELSEKVAQWQSDVSEAKIEYYNKNLEYYTKLEEKHNLDAEFDRLVSQIKIYSRCKENIVAESSTDSVASYNTVIAQYDGALIDISEEVATTLSNINSRITACEQLQNETTSSRDAINEEIAILETDIAAIYEPLKISTYFSNSESEELQNYIFEGVYTDDYVVITDVMSYSEKFEQMKILFDRAESVLSKASCPTQEFTIDVENFLFLKEFEHWSEQLETGCLINVELEQDDVAALFLSNMTINYDDRTFSMTFGNRFNKFDSKSLFDDVLGGISKSENTLNYIKDVIYPIKNGELNNMREALNTSRNLTMNAALASDNEEVRIDGFGYTGRKKLDTGNYDPRQIKITGKSIVLTNDAWESCDVAIGEIVLGDGSTTYGVNADAIIGDIIIGGSLNIKDNDGKDLLTAVDDKISTSISSAIQDVNNSIEGYTNSVTTLQQTANDVSIAIQSFTTENSDGTRTVKEIMTESGYIFDKNGLQIHQSGEEITNLITNKGMYVKRSGSLNGLEENVLVADDKGVNAMNLTARNYLIVGDNSRLENYSNSTDSKRTACFYIGE